MNQQTAATSNFPFYLKVIPGGITVNTNSHHLLVNTAWQIAYTALWNATEFSAAETSKAKEMIQQFIYGHKEPENAYNEFVQRVLLARYYINNNAGKFAPVPTQWLAENNIMGFAGTKRWFNALQLQRAAMPNYKIQLKIFAAAILEITKMPTGRVFHYWRSYFIEHRCQGLLNLMLSTVANYSYAY